MATPVGLQAPAPIPLDVRPRLGEHEGILGEIAMSMRACDRLTDRLMTHLRGADESFIERWVELLKDILLDWDLSNERGPAPAVLPELPPMAVDAFMVLMRGKMEDSLRQVAEAINRAPTGDLVGGSEEAVGRLLADLWATALETGVQLRIDSAVSAPMPMPPPQGAWASRLRRMTASGPELPVTSTPSENA